MKVEQCTDGTWQMIRGGEIIASGLSNVAVYLAEPA